MITMKKVISLLVLMTTALTVCAQEVGYKILAERDTTVKTKIEGISIGSRDVRHFVYEYLSSDFNGKPVTISGVILVPGDIANGTVPCDGIILLSHYTIGSPEKAPSAGNIDLASTVLSNPLKPNYIVVMCDYIGYGSSIDHPIVYLCGDTNARNSLDGLLAARQLLNDRQISQGKYLFNMGFSQGGTEAMYIAKLCDTEYKDRVTIDKTFVGSGMLDSEVAYSEFVKTDYTEDIEDVAMFLISVNENCRLGIDYKDMFKEPLASHVQEFIEKKDKSLLAELGISQLDSLHLLLQPAYMDLKSPEVKVFLEKLAEFSIKNGWKPDPTRQYYIEHSRHDNYVPIQCARSMISWMRKNGFTASIVPGKTSLQTNTLVFKLKHQQSGLVGLIQSLAAIQFWPVIYYEGEQNRYYHQVVHDLNLMKFIKYLESMGIDLRKIIQEQSNARSFDSDLVEGFADGSLDPAGSVRQLSSSRRKSFVDVLLKITDTLAKVNLTLTDVYEMLDDAGISLIDVYEVYTYLTGKPAFARTADFGDDEIQAPLYLLRYYEQTLANWYLQGGIDVGYDQWGW